MIARLLPPDPGGAGGSRAAAWFLVLYGVLMAVPGLIHAFAPDGGIGTIGGVDMSSDFARIRAMAAWAGATQIAHGLACIAVGLRYRALVPLFLLIALGERLVLSWSACRCWCCSCGWRYGAAIEAAGRVADGPKWMRQNPLADL